MNKTLQIILLLIIMSISFFYTEKTITIVKDYDDIMIKIKNENKRVEPINAEVYDNKIIPGICGKEIDVNRSYNKMKKYGKYNSGLLVFKNLKPKISISTKDKFIISGNKSNEFVSLIFIVKNNNEIDNVINILKMKNVKASFIFDDDWIYNNSDRVVDLVNYDYSVGVLNNSEFNNSVIKRIAKQKYNYCYTNKENINLLQSCKKNNNYTILVNNIITRNYYQNVKKILSRGSLIVLNISDQLIYELPSIITYINSKGYRLITINKMIAE